jgi:hypothetical protein
MTSEKPIKNLPEKWLSTASSLQIVNHQPCTKESWKNIQVGGMMTMLEWYVHVFKILFIKIVTKQLAYETKHNL